jgi:uncharacterized Tic20 family protein
MNLTPDSKQKTGAAGLAHLSILIPGIGFVVPLLLWFRHRKDTPYVRFQILQAFVFQMMQVLFWQVLLLLQALILILLQVINVNLHPHLSTQQALLLKALTVSGAIFLGLNLVYIGIAVWGAVMVFMGKEWTYPWFGKRLQKTLIVAGQIDPHFETRLVAAMNHFALFYGISGLFVPFLTWILREKEPQYLTYHALQALVLQAFTLVLYHALLFLQAVVAIPLMMVVISMINQSGAMIQSKTLVFGSLIASGFLLTFTFMVIPVFAIFVTIAVIRILKNKPYDYPIIGKKIKKQMKLALVSPVEPA